MYEVLFIKKKTEYYLSVSKTFAMTSVIQQSKLRIRSIDILRGVVMLIMAIDHVRDLFSYCSMDRPSPTNLATTTPQLFFTRWITHFCAPTFVFLSGTSAFFSQPGTEQKKKQACF